ncbi:hypothetical protein ACL02S_22260 [Nocardia sp. 004]|uniref:hypothetical protein n=1 Tax=Nocardia sp. 004 TaxID=3385978 RepID=UPI0039A0EE93
MGRRGFANTEGASDNLDDISELLGQTPKSAAPLKSLAVESTPRHVPSAVDVNDDAGVNGEVEATDRGIGSDKLDKGKRQTRGATDGVAVSKRSKPSAAKAKTKAASTPSTPEAHVDPVVAKAIRRVTHAEKGRRGEGRSFGEVVMDAIEEHVDEITNHFKTRAETKRKGGLFKRVDTSRPRRRRHSEAQVKIPLSGIINEDVELIDKLAVEWGAGSRSALVDQALKIELADTIEAIHIEEAAEAATILDGAVQDAEDAASTAI